MPHEKTTPVTPKGGYVDYQDDRLGRPVDTLERDEIRDLFEFPPTLEEKFQMNYCECEGVNGALPIDTLYENFTESSIEAPRSAQGDRPYRPGASAGTGIEYNKRFPATVPVNHEGVDNPAPEDVKRPIYPQRRY